MTRGRWLPLLALALVIAFGGYLRLARLGAAEFDQDDDLDMYFAGRSVQAGRGPLLPSGMAYVRGTDVTRLIAISDRYVQNPETAARLPSALLGVLGLILFAAIAWTLAGPWAAVLAASLLAIDPELVFQSRSARFYTYQAVFGLIALFAGWCVVRHMSDREAPSRDEVLRQWGWAAVTIAAFGMATRVQVTTLSVAAGWGAAVAVAAALDVRARGWRAWRRSVPLQLTVLGLALIVVVLIAAATFGVPGAVHEAWKLTSYVPTWAGGEPGSPLAYYYGLSDQFPVLLSLGPAIFLTLLFRRPRLALFLLLWFAVPLALHSLLLAWKADRYILLAMPALFLAASSVGADAFGALRRMTVSALVRARFSDRASGRLAALAVTVTALFLLVTTPAFGRVRKSLDNKIPGYTPGWRASGAVLRSIPGSDTMQIGSTSPLASLKYWGRVTFTVQRGLADNAIPAVRTATQPVTDTLPRDFYGGLPILLTPATIRAHYPHQAAVLIGVDSLSVQFNNVDSSLVRALRQRGEELCRGRCGGMRLYRFPLASVTGASVTGDVYSGSAPAVTSGPDHGEAP